MVRPSGRNRRSFGSPRAVAASTLDGGGGAGRRSGVGGARGAFSLSLNAAARGTRAVGRLAPGGRRVLFSPSSSHPWVRFGRRGRRRRVPRGGPDDRAGEGVVGRRRGRGTDVLGWESNVKDEG